MSIHFTKMHGLGNDFVVINAINHNFDIANFPIPKLANRHIGIGFDQLLVIESSDKADFFCRIYNSDGSEAEQCGNGLRCVARYLHEEKLHTESILRIATKAGIFPIKIHDYNNICVTMGAPTILEELLELKCNPQNYAVSVLSVGNPHAVLKVASVDEVATETIGPEIAAHDYFTAGANVGFMEIKNREHIRLRTFERGAGETLACGSNACAAVVAGIVNDWLANSVTVEFKYGSLRIEWEGGNNPIHMTGPAVSVFVGIL